MEDVISSGMTEAAVEMLLDDAVPVVAIASRLARRWPDAPALQLSLELASAANAVEQMFRPTARTRARIEALWRVAALIGADIYLLQVLGRPHARAGDLAAYWASDDPLFGGERDVATRPS